MLGNLHPSSHLRPFAPAAPPHQRLWIQRWIIFVGSGLLTRIRTVVKTGQDILYFRLAHLLGNNCSGAGKTLLLWSGSLLIWLLGRLSYQFASRSWARRLLIESGPVRFWYTRLQLIILKNAVLWNTPWKTCHTRHIGRRPCQKHFLKQIENCANVSSPHLQLPPLFWNRNTLSFIIATVRYY